jgi:hypothetical protein
LKTEEILEAKRMASVSSSVRRSSRRGALSESRSSSRATSPEPAAREPPAPPGTPVLLVPETQEDVADLALPQTPPERRTGAAAFVVVTTPEGPENVGAQLLDTPASAPPTMAKTAPTKLKLPNLLQKQPNELEAMLAKPIEEINSLVDMPNSRELVKILHLKKKAELSAKEQLVRKDVEIAKKAKTIQELTVLIEAEKTRKAHAARNAHNEPQAKQLRVRIPPPSTPHAPCAPAASHPPPPSCAQAMTQEMLAAAAGSVAASAVTLIHICSVACGLAEVVQGSCDPGGGGGASGLVV